MPPPAERGRPAPEVVLQRGLPAAEHPGDAVAVCRPQVVQHFVVGPGAQVQLRVLPLLEGLPQSLCPCPHWGTVLKGSIHVRYADGREEVVRAGDVYYWPPGHTVWVDEDYEAVEFSPSRPMCDLIDHLNSKLGN